MVNLIAVEFIADGGPAKPRLKRSDCVSPNPISPRSP